MEGITITVSKEKAEELFYNALCNGLNYFCSCAGFKYEYDEKMYRKAKLSLLEKGAKSLCFEDVLMEVLRIGGTLNLIDEEGNGDNSKNISLKDVHDRVAKTPTDHLMDMVNEEDDATTAYIMIQAVMYDGEIIFG